MKAHYEEEWWRTRTQWFPANLAFISLSHTEMWIHWGELSQILGSSDYTKTEEVHNKCSELNLYW